MSARPLDVSAQLRSAVTPGVVWLTALMFAICFEGLGRKFLPMIPAQVFYFVKDLVLIAGVLWFGLRRQSLQFATRRLGAFTVVVVFAFGWTLIQLANPEHLSPILGVLGVRAYWLWWLAPLAIVTALRGSKDIENAMLVVAFCGLVVALFGVVQFAFPSDHSLNVTAYYEGELMRATDRVRSTDRARVSSTFSFMGGFSAFTMLSMAVLLPVGLGSKRRLVRWGTLAAAMALAAAVPTTGSRSPVVIVLLIGVLVSFATGFINSKIGRRSVVVGFLVGGAIFFAMPQAVQGVQDRFLLSDTEDRVMQAFEILPPVLLTNTDLPAFGIGTGMQLNARKSLGVRAPRSQEGEWRKILLEQGIPGYLLIWVARLGVIVALLRMGWLARRARDRTAFAMCVALAILVPRGNLVFDHVYQTLFFTYVGLAMAISMRSIEAQATARG
jgi:hypothetical protein